MKSSCDSSAANRTATPPCNLLASATRLARYALEGCFSRARSVGSAEQRTSNAAAKTLSNFISLLSTLSVRRAKEFLQRRGAGLADPSPASDSLLLRRGLRGLGAWHIEEADSQLRSGNE